MEIAKRFYVLCMEVMEICIWYLLRTTIVHSTILVE